MSGTSRHGLALILAASALAGCGAERRASVHGRVDEILRAAPDSPALQAEAARVEASLAREGEASVLDGINLRVEDVQPQSFEALGDGIDVETRVSIRNPWATASERRAREAETDGAIAHMQRRALELDAEDCTRGLEAAASTERQALHGWYEAQLEPLLRWSADCRAAGTIDELDAERLALGAQVTLEKRRPPHVEPPAGPEVQLPSIQREKSAPLDRRPETIAVTIDGHQPRAASMRAAARAYQELAQRARRRRLPWFGFVGVSYEFRAGDDDEDLALEQVNTADTIGAELTVDIPFGLDLHAETERYEALSRAETQDAEAAVQEAARLAQEALGQIAEFEGQGERLAALVEQADRAQALVERWSAGRLGDPRRVASVLEQIFELRLEVVDARERAGLAGCVLLETTGLSLTQWPRQ
jgi:hypothetical protein